MVANVAANQSQPFFASVTGTSDRTVTWQVNGTAGGDTTVGTIDSSGLYTAPALIPDPKTVTVTAVLQANPSKSGSASVTVTLGLTPRSVRLHVRDSSCTPTQQFDSAGASAVDWLVNGIGPGDPDTTFGTITTSGFYTAPSAIPDPLSFNLTATAQADPAESASALITIDAGDPDLINQVTQARPIALGTTGGNANDKSSSFCCSGTLGALVTRNSNLYILSNNHVLARSGKGVTGEAISQPGLVDNQCNVAATVANLTQASDLNSGGTSLADAAIAQIITGQVDPSGAILGFGPTSCGIASAAPPANTTIAPAVGMPVAKSGRTTGLTCSTISAIDVDVQVQYENSCGSNSTFLVTFNNQAAIDSTTFGGPGDSGSLIVDSQTSQPVALLFAGDNPPTVTIANPIADVFTALADPSPPHEQPTFVGGATHPVSACVDATALAAKRQGSAVPFVSQLPDAEVARATVVKKNHLSALEADPAVIGVGVGAGSEPGRAAVIVFVDKEKMLRHPIPAALDGVEARVERVGRFRAYRAACPATIKAAPVSISPR
ncbi:MAG: S1 family peptidase [Acidobacteriia bacterium]|nr:S1 family peptidase [Terriglobia bacterium]